MIKSILQCAMALVLMAAPLSSVASEMLGVEQVAADQEPQISISQSTVYVSGGSGLTLEVVSLTGKSVMTVRIDSPSQRVDLNLPKGCYILKIGKVVRKVSVR